MQLPTLILDKMDAWHTYWMHLYNQFNNDLSIAARGEIYPELANMNFGGKIAELWAEWYLNSKMRYSYIKRHSKVLPKMLPAALAGETKAVSERGLEFKRFGNPREVVASKLTSIMGAFQARPATVEHWDIPKERKQLIDRLRATS
jgi:hypothetical protein